MINTRSAALVLGALVLPFVLTACPETESGTVAPTEGVIVRVTPASVACADKGAATVAVTYQPDGRDAHGSVWPHALACVTPQAATELAEGGRFKE